MPTRFFLIILITAAALLAAGGLHAQEYPLKPVRIVAGDAGGGSDITARLIAQGVAGSLGQQLIVENRGGNIANTVMPVARAPADGYTIVIYGGTFWIAPLLEKLPYDPVRDFAPITMATSSPSVVVVHPSLPVKSVKELIALAKARRGELNYASGPVGSSNHLSAELFKSMAGVNIVRIPYKGTGSALIDLMGGQVQIMFANAVSVGAHIKSGKLRALAVTGAQPSAVFPGLPTVAESGLAGYESASTQGMFAPVATPSSVINRLNQEIVRALNRTDIKDSLLRSGVDVVANSPEQFAARIKSEMTRLGKLIRDGGIREEQ